MISGGIYTSTVGRVLTWARSHSLWYLHMHMGCCADEVIQTLGAKYDIERFGCLPQVDPRQADLLVVSGLVNRKSAPEIKRVYDQMLSPKYVIALGACACSGGIFSGEGSYATKGGLGDVIPVDVFVAGCPPRPEAIMDGLITLQEKIRGNREAS